MKKVFKKGISAALSLAMCASSLCSIAGAAEGDDATKLISKDNVDFRFGLMSDSHVTINNNCAAISQVNKALSFFKTQEIDGLAFNGDIVYQVQSNYSSGGTVNTLTTVPYEKIKESINTYLPGFYNPEDPDNDKFVFATGNHEFLQGVNDEAICNASLNMFKDQMKMEQNTHTVIGGYHFITSGGKNYDSYMDETRLNYVMDEVKAAEKLTPDKPIFVLLHHPIHETVRGSDTLADTRYSKEFKDFFNARPNVIVLHAHIHSIAQNPYTIWQDGFTVYHSPLTGGGYMDDEGFSTELLPKGELAGSRINYTAQTTLVDVTKDNLVKLYRFDLNTNTMIGEPFVIDINAGKEGFKYTAQKRAAEKVTPHFANDAALTASNVANTYADITFPQGVCDKLGEQQDGYVSVYTVKAVDKETGKTAFEQKYISDYYKPTAKRQATMTAKVSGLDKSTDYTVYVYPETPLGTVGEALTLDIKTTGLKEELTEEEQAKQIPTADILDIQFINDNIDDLSPRQTKADTFGAPSLTAVGSGYKYASFDGSDDAYRYNIKDVYSKYTSTLTVESTFRLNSSKSASIFSGEEAGGTAIRYADGNVYFDIYVNGGYKIVSAPVNTGEWIHAVGTYDGKTVKLYINGEPVAELAANGKIGWPPSNVTEEGRAFAVGADIAWNNTTKVPFLAYYFNGDVLNGRIYSEPVTIGAVSKMYKNSLNILSNVPDKLVLSAADYKAVSSGVTSADGSVTIPSGGYAEYVVNTGANATYNFSLTSSAGSNVTVSVNDVIKIHNASFKSGAEFGWANICGGESKIKITNAGTSALVMSAVNLEKRVYSGNEEFINLPAFNYNSGGNNVGYYASQGNSTFFNYGENLWFYAGDKATSFQPGFWMSWDVELEKDQDYYLVMSDGVQKNSNPKYQIEVDGKYKQVKTLTDSAITSGDNYQNQLRLIGKLSLKKGMNTIKHKSLNPSILYRAMLLRADQDIDLSNAAASTVEVTATSSQIYLKGNTSVNDGSTTMASGNGRWSFQLDNRLGYLVYISSPGTYSVDIYGGTRSNPTVNLLVDNKEMHTVTLENVEGYTKTEKLATAEMQLDAGMHMIEVKHNGSWEIAKLAFTKTKDYMPDGYNYEVKINAEDFNLYGGQGKGFYDLTPDGLDQTFYSALYSPVEIGQVGSEFVAGMAHGEWLAYDVYAPKAGEYNISAIAGTGDDSSVTLSVIAGDSTATNTCSVEKDWGKLENLEIGKIQLNEGYNKVLVRNDAPVAAVNMKSVTFSMPIEPYAQLLESDGSEADTFAADTAYSVKAKLSKAEDSAYLIVALYSPDGSLIKTQVEKFTGEKTIENFNTGNAAAVKLMIWNDIHDLVPVTDVKVIEKAAQ